MIDFRRLGLDDARAALAPLCGNPKWDTSDGLDGVDSVIGGGVAFMAQDEAGPLGVLVVEQVQKEHGVELEIRAGLQLSARVDLTARVLPAAEHHFGVGCKSVSIWTRRPGLVRKLQSAGYSQAAVMMRKELP
jgi:hypothetical protein